MNLNTTEESRMIRVQLSEGFYIEVYTDGSLVGDLDSTQDMFVVSVDGRRAGIDKSDLAPIVAKLYEEERK